MTQSSGRTSGSSSSRSRSDRPVAEQDDRTDVAAQPQFCDFRHVTERLRKRDFTHRQADPDGVRSGFAGSLKDQVDPLFGGIEFARSFPEESEGIGNTGSTDLQPA